MKRLLPALALLLAACGQDRPQATPDPVPAKIAAKVAPKIIADPYPSTYAPYPGVLTAIRNAHIFDGEGAQIDHGTIIFHDGKIDQIGGPDLPIPDQATILDATGKWITPGIVDVHSHLGDYPSPGVAAHQDGNEISGPVRAEVWAEHSVWPQDPGFSRALTNGGVTTIQILPGSANLFGGRSVTVKNVPARTVQAMKFPGAPYGLKMACGENPKRIYGAKGQMPSSRMGNIAIDRQTWINAAEYRRKIDKGEVVARNLQLETLGEVLAGRILVHNHCYRADEMAQMIDMAKEFGYHISTFHHAIEAYKITDLLVKEGICAALWADWWGFKMEAYDGIHENIALLHRAGGCAIVHSDDPNGIQRLNQEAAKALAAGRRLGIQISDAEAWRWLAINPARAIGVADQTGSLKPGKMADVVLWNGHPLSVYTRPEKVWIDGALLFDARDPQRRPMSDFELGQPGEGDIK